MIRLSSLVFLIALGTPALAQITGSIPPTPALKRDATVASDLVRIGDLVDNAGTQADVPIFRAPDLGQTGAVPAYRVIDAIRAHGIILVDTKGLAEVTVTRASRVMTIKEIEGQIARAIAAQYNYSDPKNLQVRFEREVRPVQVDPSASRDLQLSRLFHDPRTGRFDISFDLPSSVSERRGSLRYVGTVVETVEATILTRTLARGEVVKAGDVLTERRPKAEIAADVLAADAPAIGLAARQTLRPGQPLRTSDLMRPELVQRNEAVTIIYEAPGITLTMRGKAVDSGSEGDLVNVMNIQSKRTVQGVVSGPGRVTIASNAAAAPVPRATDVVP